MFSKSVSGVETLLGRDCEIRGNISSKGTVRIDGKIEGNVTTAEGVVVGEAAIVKGNIQGKHVVIGGKVTGDVTAFTKLEILHTGKLYGDIRAPKLMIAEGVIFEGSCEMEKVLQELQDKK